VKSRAKSIVHPGEVLKDAILTNATSVLFMYSRPLMNSNEPFIFNSFLVRIKLLKIYARISRFIRKIINFLGIATFYLSFNL